MKKLFLGIFLFAAIGSQAQTNLQVHYDFGKGRSYVTTTLEMFKPDKWGNTFVFVDYDFNQGADNHPSLSYMEIARCINTWGGPFSAHLEYNGGLGNGFGGFAINNAWLGGVDYFMHSADYSKTLNLKALYKQIVGKQSSAQLTAVWGIQMLNKKLSFTGFADIWLEDNTFGAETTKTVFISEPQLWYNFTENLSLGSEVEFATNFGGTKGLQVNPTLGVKWNF
ncbi:MAG: DUF5020 family protein [Bacteroidia bacterium]|nr:DUF5020 family protein [Bacteroidia bacterium]